MVKNSTGGNKSKGKSRKTLQAQQYKLADLVKGEEQEYAKVEKVNGGGRYVLQCTDGKQRLGIARGSINRGVRITLGSVVLISMRDFEEGKCDILHAYNVEQTRMLMQAGEIPDEMAGKVEEDDDVEIKFENL